MFNLTTGLILICSAMIPTGKCWPQRAEMMFAANEAELEQPELAVKRRRIDLKHRYIVVRNISCQPGVEKYSGEGAKELPSGCRDLGTANGHCPSPLFNGQCPN